MILQLLSLMLLIGAALVHGQELVFDRKELQFNDATLGREVKISLKTQPQGNVYVGIKTSDDKLFVVSPCSLVFSPQNFSQPVSVVVQATDIKTLKKRTVRGSLQFEIVSEDNLGRKCSKNHQNLPLIRDFNPSRRCMSIGDPHIITFDHEKYDWSGKEGKTYYLMDSPNTSVQVQLYNCRPGKAFCNRFVAIRHYDATLTVKINRGSGAENFPSSAISLNAKDASIMSYELKQNVFNIKLIDGTRIKVGGAYNSYLNIFITVPGSYAEITSGLCGNNNGYPRPNFLSTINANPPEVPSKDDIFGCGACGAKPFPPNQIPIKIESCKPPVYQLEKCEPVHTTTTPPPPVHTTTTTPVHTTTTPPPIHTTSTPPPIHTTSTPPVYTTSTPPPPIHTTTTIPVYSTVPPPVYSTVPPPAGYSTVPPPPAYSTVPPPSPSSQPPPLVYHTVPPPVYHTVPPCVQCSQPSVPEPTCPPLPPPPKPEEIPYCDELEQDPPVVAGITSVDMPENDVKQETQAETSGAYSRDPRYLVLTSLILAFLIGQQ